MTATTNYYQRSIDISVLQGITGYGMTTVDQSLFNNGGEVCTGIQKLIQRWIIRFLTPKNSVKFHSDWGSDFLENATSFHSEIDAELSFYSANADVCGQLIDEEDDSMELDERLENVKLNDITVNSTGFILDITITSQYGTTAPLVLPVTVNPLQL